MVARAPAPFEVVPAYVDFGRVALEDVPSLSDDVHVTLAEGEQRALRVRLTGSSFLASCESRQLVRVRPAGTSGFGSHYDTLELFLDGASEEVIRVPVHVDISPSLSTVPSSFILRRESAGRFRPVHWILISNDRSSPLGEVCALNAPPEFRIEELGRIDDHRRRYRVTIEERWEAPGRFLLELEDSATGQRCEVLLTSSRR